MKSVGELIRLAVLAIVASALLVVALLPPPDAIASEVVAPGFDDTAVLGTAAQGIPQLTMMRFAPDGEVFAAGQDGRVWWYPNLDSTTPSLVTDLGGGQSGLNEVYDFWDVGLLGLAIDPAYPVRPYVYLLYTYDAPPGRQAPVWPWDPMADMSTCPTPPGPTIPNADPGQLPYTSGDGCVASGRLSRITIDLRTHAMVPGSERPLIKNDWCVQAFVHTVGDLQFAADGSLYVSAGAGGLWNVPDYGEVGGSPGDPITPANPCGDPTMDSGPGNGHPGLTVQPSPSSSPGGISGAEGGMLRAQSFRRPLDQPATLDGTIARVDPATGNPLPTNPNFSAPDIDRRRIVAYGLRQPFRFTIDPQSTNTDLWIGDVGESTIEAVAQDSHPLTRPTLNFGWPCYEGDLPGPTYGGISYFTNFALCAPTVTSSPLAWPFYSYLHYQPIFPGDLCDYRDGSALSAISFADDHSPYPSVYRGALFLGDYTRNCIWALLPDQPGRRPDPSQISEIVSVNNASSTDPGSPVDLELGPDHNLYYADGRSGAIRMLSYAAYPDAAALADVTFGGAPLTVHFRGERSTSPDPGATYVWKLGDASKPELGPDVTHRYTAPGLYTATLTVTDRNGNADSSSIRIAVGPIFSASTVRSELHFTILESALMKVSFARQAQRGRRTSFERSRHELTFPVPAGRGRWPFSRWIRLARLTAGVYRATLRPYYGSVPVAPPLTATFRVRSARRRLS